MILVDGAVTRLRLEQALGRYAQRQGWQLEPLAPGAVAALSGDHHLPGAPPPRCLVLFTTRRAFALAASPELDEDAVARFLRTSLRCPVAVGLSATTPGIDDMVDDDDGAFPTDFLVHQAWGAPTPRFDGEATGWLSDGASAAWRFIAPPPVSLEPRQQRALLAAWDAARPATFEALGVRLTTAARAGSALVVEFEAPGLGVFPLWLEPSPGKRAEQATLLAQLVLERLERRSRHLPDEWTDAPDATLARIRSAAGLEHVTGLARAGLPAFTQDSTRNYRLASSFGFQHELLLQGLDWLTDERGFVARVQQALRSANLTRDALEARANSQGLQERLDAAISAEQLEEATRLYLEFHRAYYEHLDPQKALGQARAKVTELVDLERQRRARLTKP